MKGLEIVSYSRFVMCFILFGLMVSLPQNPWEANEWTPVKVWSVTSLALNSLYIFFSDQKG